MGPYLYATLYSAKTHLEACVYLKDVAQRIKPTLKPLKSLRQLAFFKLCILFITPQ